MLGQNLKAAISTLIPGKRFASPLLMLLVLLFSARTGWSQAGISRGPLGGGDGSIATQHQNLDGSDTSNGGLDSTIAERRMKLMNNERRKSLVSDSEKLFKLATELNNEIAHSNSGALTPDQLRKVAEIEKLARNVRDKMTMTLPPPATSYFPMNGPPFSQ